MAGNSKNMSLGEGSSSSNNPAPHPVLANLNAAAAQFANVSGSANQQKYSLLLATIEEIGKQIRPAHTGNKNAVEQMKRHIAFAKLLIRELLAQVDMNLNNMALKERRESASNQLAALGEPPRKKSMMGPSGDSRLHSNHSQQNSIVRRPNHI